MRRRRRWDIIFFLSLSPFLLSVRLSAKIWEMTGAEKDIIAFPVFSGQFRGEKTRTTIIRIVLMESASRGENPS